MLVVDSVDELILVVGQTVQECGFKNDASDLRFELSEKFSVKIKTKLETKLHAHER